VLRDTFDWLEAEHGSIAAYLEWIGVDEDVMTSLRRRLSLPA
jgi:hypothetical protein